MRRPNPRRVYVSTGCLPFEESLSARLDRYAEAGLNDVELGARVTVDQGQLDTLTPSGRRRFLVHNYFPPPKQSFVFNLASGNAETVRRSRDLASYALRLCAELGVPFYSLHVGFVTDPVFFDGLSFVFPAPRSDSEAHEAEARYEEQVAAVAEEAQRLGLGLLIENQPCTEELRNVILLPDAERMSCFFRTLASSNLGMLLDTGHLQVSARTLGFALEAFASEVAPHVRAMHVHENDGVADLHWPAEPDGPVAGLLGDPGLRDAVLVVESSFESVAALKAHADRLSCIPPHDAV